MSYDRDYILRMAREFATFLARIVRSKDEGRTQATLAEIDQAARVHVGLGEARDDAPSDRRRWQPPHVRTARWTQSRPLVAVGIVAGTAEP